jgi:hypothetical protein
VTVSNADSPVPEDNYVGRRSLLHLWRYLSGADTVVPFSALVKARRASMGVSRAALVSGSEPEVAERRAEAAHLEERLRRAFVRQNGKIVNEYYCPYAVGAAAMTEATDEEFRELQIPARALHTVINTSSDRLLSMESRCDTLVNDAVTVFGQSARSWGQMRYATDSAYYAMATVLYAADALADPAQSSAERRAAVLAAARKVQLTTERVQTLLQRHARFSYFVGVLCGSALALLACAGFGLLASAYWSNVLNTPSVVAATSFGALGAMTSVFQRISSGQLVLDYTAPRGQRLLLGGLRPFIGAMFGAVVHFGFVAGFVSGQVDQGTAAAIGLSAVAGFGAGFSERFATDMIERAGQVITGSTAASGGTRAATGERLEDQVIGSPVTQNEVDGAAADNDQTGR